MYICICTVLYNVSWIVFILLSAGTLTVTYMQRYHKPLSRPSPCITFIELEF